MQVVNFTVLTVKYMQIMICCCVKISDIDYYIFLLYLNLRTDYGNTALARPCACARTVRAHGQYNHRCMTAQLRLIIDPRSVPSSSSETLIFLAKTIF